MNSKERREYEDMNLRRRNEYERFFMKRVYNALLDFNKIYSSLLKERGIEAVRSELNKVTFSASIGEIVRKIYKAVGLSYAKSTYKEVIRSTKVQKKSFKGIPGTGTPGGQINFNDKWTNDILEYFRMFLINKAVVPITIESKNRIMQILDMGSKEGWSIERMSKELETDRLLMYRARLIVRTETAKAAYYGRRIGAEDSGFETTKEWVAARDSRTRHAHRDVDAEVIDFNGKYTVPVYKGKAQVGIELMRGPGDPEASAGNVCNCRCTEAYLAKRDSNNRLIRKPTSRISVISPLLFNRPRTTITI
jgi:hypothetical protein